MNREISWAGWFWLLAFTAIVVSLLIFGGCSHAASDLFAKQYAIQNCILSGGHARLGPDNTILCDHPEVP
jgi:hypothetical protein